MRRKGLMGGGISLLGLLLGMLLAPYVMPMMPESILKMLPKGELWLSEKEKGKV